MLSGELFMRILFAAKAAQTSLSQAESFVLVRTPAN
jgi:hypothetical protein